MSRTQSRLPGLLPEQLDDRQAALYSSIVDGPRSGQAFSMLDDEGRLLGPFDALLRTPDLGAALEQVGVQLRFHCALSARERELIILYVAARWRSSYEWYAHSAVVRSQQLATEAELADLERGRVPESCSVRERLMLAMVEELLSEHALAEATFTQVAGHLDEQEITEVVVCAGYYWLLAALLAAYRIGSPAAQDDPFRDPT